METPSTIKRTFEGLVVSDAMQKTLVVRVDRIVVHPKYKKHYRVSKRYKVHDEKEQYTVGDKVRFSECRPISKSKRWRVIEKII